MNRPKEKKKISVILTNILLAAICLLPLYWTFITSVKGKAEIYAQPLTLFPQKFTLENFNNLFQYRDSALLTFFRNSIIIDICTVALVTVISILAGFAFSKLEIFGKKIWMTLTLFTIMVPFQALMVPLYNTMSSLKLLNSLPCIVLIYVTYQTPFCVLMMKSSFDMIPTALHEAATIDGANSYTAFRKIFLPLAKPGIVTVIVYSAYTTWNDYIIALTFGGTHWKTFNVGLVDLAINESVLDWGIMTSGSIISLVPIMILFLFLQKYFVKGMMSGAIK